MKAELHKLVSEWDESLHLPGRTYWKIEGVATPQLFFHHLPKIFSPGMTLLIEGHEIGLSAKSLYEEFPAVYTQKVACDALDPIPDSYHVAFSADFSERLCRLIESQGAVAAFDHFKGYSQSEIVFTFHDAFQGELVLSSSLSEVAVRAFADKLGCRVERAEFPTDLRQQLIDMDRILNPPWWKRALRVFKRNEPA